MTLPTVPFVDPENPFYCPEVPAATFLNSLKSCRRPKSRKQPPFAAVSSFAQLLSQTLLIASDSQDDCANFGPLDNLPKSPLFSPVNLTKHDFRVDGRLPSVLASIKQALKRTPSTNSKPIYLSFSKQQQNNSLKRKRTESFTEFRGPPKHFKSLIVDASGEAASQEDSEMSFVCNKFFRSPPCIQVVADDDKLQRLEDALYGPHIGAETPRSLSALLERLDSLIPGVRLKERIRSSGRITHQTIADFLGYNGYLSPQVLNLLRTSEIESLSLAQSLDEHDGLNLASRDLLSVFDKPNGFYFLTALSFKNAVLHDGDLAHIHHLPRLSLLVLQNTRIGNEAVFMLSRLKVTLQELSIAENPRINDEAIPALILLSKLTFLSIMDTSINMPGLRKLANTIHKESRTVDIEIPEACETYIDHLQLKYLLYPKPPLITAPSLCQQLSAAALKRNLSAHATVNPSIMAGGTKTEMKERLEEILRTRELDLLVKGMICNV